MANLKTWRERVIKLLSFNIADVYASQVKDVQKSPSKKNMGIVIINYNMSPEDFETNKAYCFTVLFGQMKGGSLTEGYCFDMRDLLEGQNISLSDFTNGKPQVPLLINDSRWNMLLEKGLGDEIGKCSKEQGTLLYPLSSDELMLICKHMIPPEDGKKRSKNGRNHFRNWWVWRTKTFETK